jgi:hypothetical protein
MTTIYIVILQERHIDVDALPFSTAEAANAYARELAEFYARGPSDIEEWGSGELYHAGWGPEGDCVGVVKRTLDAP